MSTHPQRYTWLDISRVFAMLLVVYIHFFPNGIFSIPGGIFLSAAVPFYFFWSGYFASRNPHRKKLLNRFLLLFLTFITWEFMACAYHVWWNGEELDAVAILGIGGLFLGPLSPQEKVPYIGSLWFIRDLMLLTLCTPIITKLWKLGIVALVLMMAYQPLNTVPEVHVTLSLGSICFYTLGCFCQKANVAERLERLPMSSHSLLFVSFTIIVSLIAAKNEFIEGSSYITKLWEPTILGSLLGIFLITQVGIITQRLFPTIGGGIAHFAPAMVFVLITHRFIGSFMWQKIEKTWLGYCWAPLIFICCLALFKIIQRYTPCLLPYLAYSGTPHFLRKNN